MSYNVKWIYIVSYLGEEVFKDLKVCTVLLLTVMCIYLWIDKFIWFYTWCEICILVANIVHVLQRSNRNFQWKYTILYLELGEIHTYCIGVYIDKPLTLYMYIEKMIVITYTRLNWPDKSVSTYDNLQSDIWYTLWWHELYCYHIDISLYEKLLSVETLNLEMK